MVLRFFLLSFLSSLGGAGEVDGGTNVTQTRIYINKNGGTVFYLEVSREEVTAEKERHGYST